MPPNPSVHRSPPLFVAFAALATLSCADAIDIATDAGATPDLSPMPDFWAPPATDDRGVRPPPDRGPAPPEGECDPAAAPPTLEDAPRCSNHDDCEPGYECRQVENFGPDREFVCLPPVCIDRDGDGHGIGADCAGPDCNDCDPAVHPGAPERCNGVDDDCNGLLDDDPDPADRPLDDCSGLGVCSDAEQRCVAGAWVCDRPPAYEADETRCDGLDNDCDGLVDDIPGRGDACMAGDGPCAQPGVMVCDGVSGALHCNAEPLPPVDEVCNGLDDDCNGVVDDVPGVGERCTVSSGSCMSSGERRCDAVTGRLICNAPPPMPSDERCDQRDNDCDGAVDEGAPPPCGPPPGEDCNNVDDDGDGRIDEGLSQRCETDCGEGVSRCVAGMWRACDGPEREPEVCNGADDDCDGVADEAGVCGPCSGRPDGSPAGECQRWSLCGGFDHQCDSTGTEEWRCPICRNGALDHRIEERLCDEDTEGVGCDADGHHGTCRDEQCVCAPRYRRVCDGDTVVEDDNCGGVRRIACASTCVDGQCCEPEWAPPRCEGDVVVRQDLACDRSERQPCAADERCERGECVRDCGVERRCIDFDAYEVDTCTGGQVKREECNGVRGLRDGDDLCDAGACCYRCFNDGRRAPRDGERVSHADVFPGEGPDDGHVMRLELVRINPENTCGDFSLRVSKLDGGAFSAGTYHLRVGSCLPEAVIRSRASPYTFQIADGARSKMLEGIDFRVDGDFREASDERFCVTRDSGGQEAWFYSDLVMLERRSGQCR